METNPNPTPPITKKKITLLESLFLGMLVFGKIVEQSEKVKEESEVFTEFEIVK